MAIATEKEDDEEEEEKEECNKQEQ